jgi:hypothetical protein
MTKHFIACVLLAACTDTPATMMPDDEPPPPPPTSHREIKGTATFITTDESGTSTGFPLDLHDTIVRAVGVSDGDGWDIRAGISRADGTFSIAGAPEGDYWLDIYDVPSTSRNLLWTNADVIAIDQLGAGRGDAARSSPETTITFDPIDGMDTVQDYDGLELSIGNLGIGLNLWGALTPDTTTLQYTYDWTGLPLVSAAKGDSVILTQMRNVTDQASGLYYTDVVKSATLSVEQSDGHDTAVMGTFTTPPQLDYNLRWNRSEFDAISKDINPNVGANEGQMFLFSAMPGGAQYGTSVLAPLVFGFDASQIPGTTDIDLPFTITNPFPQSWLFNQVGMFYSVPVNVPGMPGATMSYGVELRTITNEISSAEHPLRPLVSPPRAPTINGMDLFVDHDGVGVTPTIAWQKPTVGQPTAYAITIEHWELNSISGQLVYVASLIVPGDVTSIQVPARVLESGEHYMLQIEAISQAGQDVRVHSLNTVGIPSGSASVVTASFTP